MYLGSSKLSRSAGYGNGARSAPKKQTTDHESAQEIPFPLISDGVVELESTFSLKDLRAQSLLTKASDIVQGRIKRVPWFTDELQKQAVSSIHEYLDNDNNRSFSKDDVSRVKKFLKPCPLADTSRDAVVQMRGWLEVWIEFYTKVGDEAKVQKIKELQSPLIYEGGENTGPGSLQNDNGMKLAPCYPRTESRKTMITVADDAIDTTEDSQQLLASSTAESRASIEKKKYPQSQQNKEVVQNRANMESPSLQTPHRSTRFSKSPQRAQRRSSTTEGQLQDSKKPENCGPQSPTSFNARPRSEAAVELEGEIAQSPTPDMNCGHGSRGYASPQRRTRTPKRKPELTEDHVESSKKKRPDSRKESPLTKSSHPRPTKLSEDTSKSKSPQLTHLTKAQQRKQNVEIYVQRAKDLNNPDLATFIEQAHNLSLDDQRTAGLVDTVLSQEPTSEQIATLQTIFDDLKSEHRKSHEDRPKPQRIVKRGNRVKSVTSPSLIGSRSPVPSVRVRKSINQNKDWIPLALDQTTQKQNSPRKAAESGPTWADKYNPSHPAYLFRPANRPKNPLSRSAIYKAKKRQMEKERREKEEMAKEVEEDDEDDEEGDEEEVMNVV